MAFLRLNHSGWARRFSFEMAPGYMVLFAVWPSEILVLIVLDEVVWLEVSGWGERGVRLNSL